MALDWDLAARAAFTTCLAAALFLTGLIWFVHAVHYPLFARVAPGEADAWRVYHAEHCRRTGFVVAGPMAAELLTSAWLAFGSRPAILGRAGALAGLALALATWGITGLLAVPAHDRLARGFDAATHRRLLGADLARALAWTGHALILLAAISRALPPTLVADR